MNSHTTSRFRELLSKLPQRVGAKARKAYRLFQQDPQHPSLQFKKGHPSQPYYSARVDDQYRVVGIQSNGTMVWFWIGHHDEYERLLAQL